MPYVRTVKTASGATAVQIVYSFHRGSRQIIQIQAGDYVITAAEPLPGELRQAIAAINATPPAH